MGRPLLYAEIRESCKAAGQKDPLPAYLRHKRGASARGLTFSLSFYEWWGFWEPYWSKRGLGALQMCMCRTRDQGGYEVGNVRIATNKENHHERALEWKVTHSQRRYRPREYRTPFNGELVHWTCNEGAFRPYKEEEEEGA